MSRITTVLVSAYPLTCLYLSVIVDKTSAVVKQNREPSGDEKQERNLSKVCSFSCWFVSTD